VREPINVVKRDCEVTGHGTQAPDLFFELIEHLKIEFLVTGAFAAALFIIPALVNLFGQLDVQFLKQMTDVLSLRVRERFLIKEAEKIIGIDECSSDRFAHSDAPLSMRIFFDYAVALRLSKTELSPQKLVFATYIGFALMKELDTFTALLNSLAIGGDFIALCDLYFEKVESPAIDYLREAAAILQGRAAFGVSLRLDGSYAVRRVPSECGFPLSPSFAFFIDSPLVVQEGADREESESVDEGSGA
jgi:hypothetical protein